ncbi:MAG: phosphatase PAP2 family protein [Acutalibacteraceae bacterium]|jgi:membrane-associated phospholipid phosphatase
MNKREWWTIGLLAVAYGLLSGSFFIVQLLRDPVWIVHVGLDDVIPFNEWFVIPYVIWYGYLAATAVYLLWADRPALIRMEKMMVLGMCACTVFFLVVPNGIDFRPEHFERENVLTGVVNWLYAHDQPENVFPSLHVYQALCAHAALWRSPVVRRHRWIGWASLVLAVLICLSTMFIKQHSICDVIGGLVLAMVTYFLVYMYPKKRSKTQ